MDGKELAARVRAEVAGEVAELGRPVGLATVLVGDDRASAIYVRRKREACAEVGIESIHHELSAETSERELLALVAGLNEDDKVTGILVQLPLPEQMDEDRVIASISPRKDVDGFHPVSAGYLLQGRPTFVAATPSGIMELLRAYEIPLAGARAVVVGRSNIVGKPMALPGQPRYTCEVIEVGRRLAWPSLACEGGSSWHRAPSSGSRTRRATASSSGRKVRTSSSTSPRSPWRATSPSRRASASSSRSCRAIRACRRRTSRSCKAEEVRVPAVGG